MNNFLTLILSLFLFGHVSGQQEPKKRSTAAEKLFIQNCSSCHNFKKNGIGPQLGGLAPIAKRSYIIGMIQNTSKMIDDKNPRTLALQKQYGTIMPEFSHLSEKEVNDLADYILEQAAPIFVSTKYGESVTERLEEKVEPSNLVVDIEHFGTIPATSTENPLTRISLLKTNPANGQMYISDLRGKLYKIVDGQASVVLDLKKEIPNFIDKPGLATGFGAFAFHPDFKENGLLYTTHTENPGLIKADFSYSDSIEVTVQWVLSEWKMTGPYIAKPRELFRIDMVTGLHGIQEIDFNPYAKVSDEDYGLLYIGIGDGGSAELSYPFITHDIEKPWGCLLRIDPLGNSSPHGKYGIPSSNPFVGKEGLAETYAMGFRNPHRFAWTQSGKLLLGNIGQKKVETINLIKPGSDFGWPKREGRFRIDENDDLNVVYAIPANESLSDFNLPAVEMDHEDIAAISNLEEYTGNALQELKGKVVFTSISVAQQFFVEESEIEEGSKAQVKEFKISYKGKITTFNELCGQKGRADLRIGKDEKGELYFFTKPDGKIYKAIGTH